MTKQKPIPRFSLYLPSRLLAEKISLAEKVILADIFSFKGEYNFPYPYIARKFGISRSTVIRSIERLSGNLGMIRSSGKAKNKGIELTEKALALFDKKKVVSKTTTEPRPAKAEPCMEAIRLSNLLLGLILERKSNFKKPDLTKWAGEIDRMIRIDKRTPERIEAVIRWAQNDSGNGDNWQGWQAVILSPKKLRDKFDTLEMKMEGNNGSNTGNTTDKGHTAISNAREDFKPGQYIR